MLFLFNEISIYVAFLKLKFLRCLCRYYLIFWELVNHALNLRKNIYLHSVLITKRILIIVAHQPQGLLNGGRLIG